MLARHGNRVCVFCALDFTPQIGPQFEEAAKHVYQTVKATRVQKAIDSYAFLPTGKEILVHLGFTRLYWQTIGLSPWTEGLPNHVALAKAVLQILGVTELKRVGVKVAAFLPLGMYHPEMFRLMFGSFLVPFQELVDAIGEPNDSLVHLDGSRGGLEYGLDISPQTSEQAKGLFRSLPNLRHFASNEFERSAPSEFIERLSQGDSLHIDVDLSRKDVAIDCLEEFLNGAVQQVDDAAEAIVARLQSKPVSKGK